MIRSALAFGLAVGLATSAAAVTPAPLRDDTPTTGNTASFRNDALFGYWDTDGTATTSNGVQNPGFLAQKYGLTPIDPPGTPTSNSVLPQLQRAVIDFQGGSATQGTANRTYGVFTPNATTGTPVSVGGTGVHSALNASPATTLNADTSSISTSAQINQPWVNFQNSSGVDLAMQPAPVVFSISRIGTTLTVKIGDGSSAAQWDHLWTATSSAFTDVNAIQLRMSAGGTSTWRITDLRYNGDLLDSTLTSGATSTYQADTLSGTSAFRETEMFLWDKVVGDFTLTGNLFLGWRVSRPTNATSNLQIALLDLPSEPVPEPASWAMMIAGFGLIGASMRRRRRVLAA